MRIEKLSLSDLNPAEYNPRTITNEALEGLENSIKTFGVVELPVVNIANNNTIVSGHQRYKALTNQGVTETECIIVDLDSVQEKALNVAMNNKHIAGDWDIEGLTIMLEDLSEDFDSFKDINLDNLAEDLNIIIDDVGEFNPDLPTGDHPGIKTATFTLSEEQFQYIDSLVRDEIQNNPMIDDPSGINENKNGNALYSICQKLS